MQIKVMKINILLLPPYLYPLPQGERSIFGFFSRNRRGVDFEVGANRKMKFII